MTIFASLLEKMKKVNSGFPSF